MQISCLLKGLDMKILILYSLDAGSSTFMDLFMWKHALLLQQLEGHKCKWHILGFATRSDVYNPLSICGALGEI